MEISSNIITEIKSLKTPLVIGVSGFGGAGKSTFATALGEALRAPVVGVDSFMKDRTLNDYSLWEAMDFARLKSEVIEPVLAGQASIRYGHFDWGTNGIADIKDIAHRGIVIVEGVGLFRPDLNQYYGYKIWVDCTVEEATLRGKKRDREEYQNPQDESWEGIWKKNDVEYFELYKPKEVANFVFNNC